MDDDIFYQSGDIFISRTLARFGETSYPISGIGSIRIEKKQNSAAVWGGILMVIVGLALATSDDTATFGWGLAIVGAIAAVSSLAEPHMLMLRTASGDVQACQDRDKKKLSAIKAAIERAVQSRG